MATPGFAGGAPAAPGTPQPPRVPCPRGGSGSASPAVPGPLEPRIPLRGRASLNHPKTRREEGGGGRISKRPSRHLRPGFGEAHGEQDLQRRAMFDGPRAVLPVPPGDDFAVQLLFGSHGVRGGLPALGHHAAIATRAGPCTPAAPRRGPRPGQGRGAEPSSALFSLPLRSSPFPSALFRSPPLLSAPPSPAAASAARARPAQKPRRAPAAARRLRRRPREPPPAAAPALKAASGAGGRGPGTGLEPAAGGEPQKGALSGAQRSPRSPSALRGCAGRGAGCAASEVAAGAGRGRAGWC